MLHTETVESGIFSLLEDLMTLPALRFGHRMSVDLDLFSHKKIDHSKKNGYLLNNVFIE